MDASMRMSAPAQKNRSPAPRRSSPLPQSCSHGAAHYSDADRRSLPMSDAPSDPTRAFPTAEAVPNEWRHAAEDTGLDLLVDGTVARWEGASQPIRSAVCLRDDRGRLAQVELGPAALASAAEGRRAVEAAARAWRGGRGEWPRATTEERIRCVH